MDKSFLDNNTPSNTPMSTKNSDINAIKQELIEIINKIGTLKSEIKDLESKKQQLLEAESKLQELINIIFENDQAPKTK